MEKYSKPVMVLEAIEDEVYTAVAYPDNTTSQLLFVSGEATTVTDNQRSPFVTNVP